MAPCSLSRLFFSNQLPTSHFIETPVVYNLCSRVESEGPKSLAIAVSLLAPEVQVLDMPVDPNEPTYCLCHQVSDVINGFWVKST